MRVAVLIAALSFVACTSTQITQPLKEQVQKNTQTKEEIKNNPKLTPQEKEAYTAAIDETEKLAEKCDKQETESREEIASLKIYKHIVWGEVLALLLTGLGVFIWKKFF